MTFRFYTERLNFSGCQGVSFTSNRYSANFKSLSGCYGTDRYFYTYYNFYSTGGNSWPYWYANDYFDFTFTFSSITGDVSNNPNFLFITSSINWYQSIYHHNDLGKCGCCGNCCNGWCCNCWDDGCCGSTCCSTYCCSYCSCRWYYSYGTFLLTGRYDINPYEPSVSTLAQSHSVELVSRQYNVETELKLFINNIYYNTGPSYSNYLLLHFDNGQSHTSTNPFRATRDEDLGAYIDCKCVVAGSISITSTTNYQHPECVRYKPDGMEPSIAVFIDIPVNNDLVCYFPGYRTNSNTGVGAVNVDILRKTDHYFHRYFPRHYWAPWGNFNAQHSFTTTGTSGSLSVS